VQSNCGKKGKWDDTAALTRQPAKYQKGIREQDDDLPPIIFCRVVYLVLLPRVAFIVFVFDSPSFACFFF